MAQAAVIADYQTCAGKQFGGLAQRIDGALGRFYERLVESESRHALVYYDLALAHANEANQFESVAGRLRVIVSAERGLVTAPDDAFRFHSGVPTETATA